MKIILIKLSTKSVALIIYACVTENPISQLASHTCHETVDIYGCCLPFSGQKAPGRDLNNTYRTICRLMKQHVYKANVGCRIVKGWCTALGYTTIGITWNVLDFDFYLKIFRINALNNNKASNICIQTRAIVKAVMREN